VNETERRPVSQRVSYTELTSSPATPSWARCQTRTVLRGWGVNAETIETAELLVSELTTNAVKFTHPASFSWWQSPGRARAERIVLTLRHLTDQVVIEVSDPDMNPPRLGDSGVNAESGRGLMLVDALSKEWSYFFPPSGGKTVYCVLSADEPVHATAIGPEGVVDD
jgi:anti-sigma regulatory factor (Ser/Thr protein kinase)